MEKQDSSIDVPGYFFKFYSIAETIFGNLLKILNDIHFPFALTADAVPLLLATLVAAFAGAAGAQYITERRRRKDNLEREFRLNNAAIIVTYNIANSLFSFKDQHCKPMYDGYVKQSKELERFRSSKYVEEENLHLFEANLRKFSPPLLPFNQLEKIVLQNINLDQISLMFLFQLKGSLKALSDLAEEKNRWIESYRSQVHASESHKAALYFGFENPEGHIDSSYRDLVYGIYRTSDDCIFFATKLSELLSDHGKYMGKSNKLKGLKVGDVSWNEGKTLHLMPDEMNYANWMNMLNKRPKR